MEWYYVDAGERTGPVDVATFRSLIDLGVITPHTRVWCADLPDWQALSEVTQLIDPSADATNACDARQICVECGETFPPEQLMTTEGVRVCTNCKPVYLQRVFQGTATGLLPRYANFWPRFFAKLLDMFLQTAIQGSVVSVAFIFGNAEQMVMTGIFTAVMSAVGFAITFGYSTWFLGRFGTTPGKMALGLRVIGAERDEISYGRAFLRALGEMVSSMIFFFGYLMVLFDDERRGLHDRLCNTRVVHVE